MFPLSFLLILFSPTTALQSETFPSFPVPNPVAVFTLPFDSHQREEQDPLGVAMPFTCIRCTFSVPSLLAFPDSSLFLIHYLSSSFSFPLFRTALLLLQAAWGAEAPTNCDCHFLISIAIVCDLSHCS
jgi:hypothetical protein